MIKFLIKRPIAVTMVFIALLVLGLVSLRLVPISLMPEVDIPEITIRLSSSESSVREMEDRFTNPVRRKMLQVNHLRDIESTSMNGQAFIKLYFDYGTHLQYAYLDVNEKIDALMGNMSRDFQRPQVIKASATDIPAFFLSVSLKKEYSGNEERFMELSRFCESVIKKRIEQLPEVAMADISGMDYPEIFIELDERKTALLGIDKSVIESALKDNNVSVGNIVVRDGKYIYNVRFSSVIVDRTDLENILIRKNQRVFRLNELATIGVRNRNKMGQFLAADQKALSLAIIKKNDVQMADLKSSFNDLKGQLEKDYPRLSFNVSRDQTALLAYSIGNMKNTLIWGSVLAIFIMLFFLSDYRSPLLIAISVPVSLVVTLLFFFLFGLSVNIISLSGLVLGIGMMIDNSIIVIDNIHQHHQHKKIDLACIMGTNEIIRPLVSSVLTTCAVFLPLLFLSGITGALFYDQAVAVSIGLVVSLLVSITLLPVYYRLLYKRRKENNRIDRLFSRIGTYRMLENRYDKGFDFVFRNRAVVFILLVLLSAGGFWAFSKLNKESFPKFKQDEALISINWNSNISPEENSARVKTIYELVSQNTACFNTNVGKHQFLLAHSNGLDVNEAEIYLKLKDANQLDQVISGIKTLMTENYPSAVLEFNTPPNLFEQVFHEEKTPLVVKFWDRRKQGVVNPEDYQTISSELKQKADARLEDRQVFQQYINIEPDFQKMHLYDVSFNQLFYTLKKALNGYEVMSLKNGNFLVPVVLSDKQISFAKLLSSTMVRTQSKALIPVNQFVKVDERFDYKKIAGGREGSYNELFLWTDDQNKGKVMQNISGYFEKYSSMEYSFSGMLFRNKELVKELLLVLLVAVLLLYFILASQFESVLQPFIVLLEIPIDIAGVLLVLWLTGTSLNLMSLIGIVVMTGIIINDSILKIDTINRLRKEGRPIMEAIHLGGQRRLKPIVMTSLTTILALLPFLFGSDMGSVLQAPLAISVISGMTIGTLVSLFVVPLFYKIMNGKDGSRVAG